ncbi:hypothetical protein BH11MYX2_BH11MYX2_34180 [soil metagenome]
MARSRRIVPLVLLSVLAPAAVSANPHQPPPDAKVSRALLALRDELHAGGKEAVEKAPTKFRPLCDAEGYPLVGNINDKGVRLQPSQLCADLRATRKKA